MDFNKDVFDYCQEGEEKYFNDVYWNERIQRCEGIKEGKQQGIIEGKQQEKIETAKNLLDRLSIEEIVEVTGLSIEEITNLQNEAK